MILALAGPAALILPVLPASAHSGDPRVSTVVDDITPALPAGVVVQTAEGVAAQLVAANPTSAPLEVLGADGRPFLRLSSAGVFGDLGAPDFLDTSLPNGGQAPRPPGPDRWVRVSSGDSWGWYDHRLHRGPVTVPPGLARDATLSSFSVPMRYAGDPVLVRGHLQFTPLLGGFMVDAGPGPAGVDVQVLQGPLPGLLLAVAPQVALDVAGRDGELFARFRPAGVQVNESSRTWVEDRTARGLTGPPPAAQPRWVGRPGVHLLSWLDARLRYPQRRPPARLVGRESVVQRWSVPVVAGGHPGALTGAIRWVPVAQSTGTPHDQRSGVGTWARGLIVAAGLVVGVLAAVLVARRLRARRRARGAG